MSGEKVRENRIRRTLERRGLLLVKSRRRDPKAWDFGLYRIDDLRTNVVVAGGEPGPYSMSIDEVEAWLAE